MFDKILKSELHNAVVTGSDGSYTGGIALDAELMQATGISPYEVVEIADFTNSNRLQSYAVPTRGDDGKVIIMGASSKLIKPGDVITIMSFCYCETEEKKEFTPRLITLDENNEIIKSE